MYLCLCQPVVDHEFSTLSLFVWLSFSINSADLDDANLFRMPVTLFVKCIRSCEFDYGTVRRKLKICSIFRVVNWYLRMCHSKILPITHQHTLTLLHYEISWPNQVVLAPARFDQNELVQNRVTTVIANLFYSPGLRDCESMQVRSQKVLVECAHILRFLTMNTPTDNRRCVARLSHGCFQHAL